jgi:hypothetical protein
MPSRVGGKSFEQVQTAYFLSLGFAASEEW